MCSSMQTNAQGEMPLRVNAGRRSNAQGKPPRPPTVFTRLERNRTCRIAEGMFIRLATAGVKSQATIATFRDRALDPRRDS